MVASLWHCHGIAMAVAMAFQCHCHGSSHGIAMALLPRLSHFSAMAALAVPLQCNGRAMAGPWRCNGSGLGAAIMMRRRKTLWQ